MYILKTELYSNGSVNNTEFDEFKDAVIAAEHIAELVRQIIDLTRHSSCESSIIHCGYYADHYNELCITVEKKK